MGKSLIRTIFLFAVLCAVCIPAAHASSCRIAAQALNQRLQPKIEVAFELDASGMLAVSAADSLTGRQQSMRIEAPVALRQEESGESVLQEGDEQFG